MLRMLRSAAHLAAPRAKPDKPAGPHMEPLENV